MTVKWSAFAAGTTIAGSDNTVGLQGGANVKWTWSQVATYIAGAVGITVGTTPTSGGATGQVLFDTGTVVSESAGLKWSSPTLTIGVAGSTVGGVAFTNATSGTITLNAATGALGSAVLTLPAVTDTVAVLGTAQTFSALKTFSAGVSIASAQTLDWNNDTFYKRDGAANVTAQVNGTNAQTHRLYETTNGTDYSRVALRYDAGTTTFVLYSEVGGAGTLRGLSIGTTGLQNLNLTTNSTQRIVVRYDGMTYPVNDNAIDLGLTGTNRFRDYYGAGKITSAGATAGIGYATGAGGAVTQGTNRTTGVTLNKVCGTITLVSAAGTATWQTFTLTNSAIVAVTDVVHVSQQSGTDLYQIIVTNTAVGSCKISFATTGGTTTEQPIFNFVVTRAVAA